jgi:hypothetical protein
LKSRLLLWATVAGGALYLASAVCLGTPPGADESGVQVAMWFREHRDSVRLYVWMLTVNAPLFALVFALLRECLLSPHRDVFLIGAVSFIATTAVQAWSWGGLALHADRLEPGTARTVLDVAVFWGPVLRGAVVSIRGPIDG